MAPARRWLRAASALAAVLVHRAAGEEACASGEPALLTGESVNPRVRDAEYAVRGPILLRALEIEADLAAGRGNHPFKQIVKCNIGNPQALGQRPITFSRQVLSLVLNPALLDDASVVAAFPSDAVARARRYLAAVGSAGAYSESQGVTLVREEVAAFIEDRDGVRASKDNVFLTAGASQAVQQLLTILIRSQDDAVLVPIPQYPLYSSLTTLLGGHMAGYLMGEANGWELDLPELRAALDRARAAGKTVRALVVINPGNPTGSTLSEESMLELIEFCEKEKLVLLADEVYQTNIYREDRPFISFRRALHTAGILDEDGTMARPFQLASFHSVSKGVVGECGLRGGYGEYLGFPRGVRDQIYKLASIGLCSNVPGQLSVGLMVNPPRSGDPSFELYQSERSAVFDSLRRRANKLEAALNSVPGVKCNPIEGAMYAFPQIDLPAKFVAEAKAAGEQPDQRYALRLLESTGLVAVPGSGFGQREGTYHVRTTFLPPEELMDEVLERFRDFHTAFVQEYAN